MTRDQALVAAMKDDPARADLPARAKALVDYALKLTREPGGMTAADLEPFRAAGLTDVGILDACQVAAYYAFVNRLAQGLGVELEG